MLEQKKSMRRNRGNVMNWLQLSFPKTLHCHVGKGEKMQSKVEPRKKKETGANVLQFFFSLSDLVGNKLN